MKYRFYILLLAFALALPAMSARKEKEPVSSAPHPQLTTAQLQRFDYYLYAGIREIKRQNYDKAVTLLSLCQQLDSNCALVNFHLGNIYHQQNIANEALHYYQRAFRLEPESYWNNYISILWQSKETQKQAIAELANAYSQHPDATEMMSALVMLYSQSGQSKKAIALLDDYERRKGPSAEITREKCNIYIQQNKPKKAISAINRYLALEPDDYMLSPMKGDILYAMGDKRQAFVVYEQEKQRHPSNPYNLISRANYFLGEKEYEQASNELKTLFRSDIDVDYKLSLLKSQQLAQVFPTDSSRAEIYELILSQHPDEPQVLSDYADCLFAQGKVEKAVTIREAIMQIEPFNYQNTLSLYDYYARLHSEEKLTALIDTCYVRFPKVLFYHYAKMISYAISKDHSSLLAIGRHAVQLDPTTDKNSLLVLPLVYSMMGFSYFQTDSLEQGIACYEQALKLMPGDLETLNNYAYMLAINNLSLGEAERMSRQTIEKQPDNPVYLDTYAWILYLRGETVLAQYYIKKAMEKALDKSDAELQEHYKIILGQ